MTTYVYKSTTGRPVNVEDYVVTVNPGLQSTEQIEALDAFIGSSISRYDDGVLTSADNIAIANLALDSSGNVTGLVGPGGDNFNVQNNKFAPLTRGPTPRTVLTQAGTGGSASFAGKKRVQTWAGIPGEYVYRNGTMHISDLQFGTKTTDTPASYASGLYCTDIETGGTYPALATPVMVGTEMQIAGGRFRHRADGSIRVAQFADDALYSSSPRFQLTSFILPARQKLVSQITVQFGDAETPWFPYVVNKNNCLFWQVKGPTGQPPIALIAVLQSDGLLRIDLNRKLANATGIFTCGSVSGLKTGVPIDIEITMCLDWLTQDEGGTSFLALRVNGVDVQLSDSSAYVEGRAITGEPTLFTDVSQAYVLITGIYRYDYSTKAPNDCAVVFSKHSLYISN